MSDDRRLRDRLKAAWDAFQHGGKREAASRPAVLERPDPPSFAHGTRTDASDRPDRPSFAHGTQTDASDRPPEAPPPASDRRTPLELPPADAPPPTGPEPKWKVAVGILVAFAIVVLVFNARDTDTPTVDAPDEPAAAEPADPAPVPEREPYRVPKEEAADPAPEPEPQPVFSKNDYADLTDREFSKIARDPDSHVGEKVLLFGEVFQFDSFTGTDQFLADVGGDRDTEGEESGVVLYDHNALLVDGTPHGKFDDVVEGDHIAAWVTVAGSYDYDTQIGGTTTASMFMVDRIKVLPPVE